MIELPSLVAMAIAVVVGYIFGIGLLSVGTFYKGYRAGTRP